jgi:hypothetical protein
MSKIFTVNERKYTNKHGIAPVFVKAVTNDDYTKGDSKFSASDLIAPPKAVALERMHEADIVTDVADLMAIFRGHGLHRELERHANPNGIAEERLYATLGGIKISMKPDHYDGDTRVLEDYKSTSVWAFKMGDKPEWEQQLNIGAWFLHKYGFVVKGLAIQAILYDWNRNEARRNDDYPQSGFHTKPIKQWPIEKTEHFIRNRLSMVDMACAAAEEGGPLPDCTPEERWQSATTWALIKKGNKRATKVCDSHAQAVKYKEGHKDGAKMEIIERPGEAKRCENYCDAAPWCEQYQSEKGE